MASPPLIQMRGIGKSFDSVKALDNINYVIRESRIHGLVGGNGAGKTTLMNILYGLYEADSGEILLHGKRVTISKPADALRHHIGMVHQHFKLIENFTVAKNVILGTKLEREPLLDLEQEYEKIRKLSDTFGLDIDPEAIVRDLPVGMKQRVEILKPLYRGARLLILDEPTTNLTPQEADFLFSSLETMVREGMSTIFITHKMREATRLCDEITVLRDGKVVGTVERKEASEENLVRMMVGEEMNVEKSILFAGALMEEKPVQQLGEPVLIVENLSVTKDKEVLAVEDTSFCVFGGEIFGIAGVSGNGQRELVEALMGIRPIAKGNAYFAEASVTDIQTKGMLSKGGTYIPEDRVEDGYLPSANVAENLVLGFHNMSPYSDGLSISWRNVFDSARNLIGEFGIKTTGPHERAARLSGGNIQKLIVARAFSRPVKLIIAHNPTRGLDIKYTELTYRKLIEARNKGTAILLVSENLDELLLLCDRIGVMYKGGMGDVLRREEFDRYKIGAMMGGISGLGQSTEANA